MKKVFMFIITIPQMSFIQSSASTQSIAQPKVTTTATKSIRPDGQHNAPQTTQAQSGAKNLPRLSSADLAQITLQLAKTLVTRKRLPQNFVEYMLKTPNEQRLDMYLDQIEKTTGIHKIDFATIDLYKDKGLFMNMLEYNITNFLSLTAPSYGLKQQIVDKIPADHYSSLKWADVGNALNKLNVKVNAYGLTPSEKDALLDKVKTHIQDSNGLLLYSESDFEQINTNPE